MRVTVNVIGCRFDFHSKKWTSPRLAPVIPTLNMQCLQNSAESGERTILILGFPCLPQGRHMWKPQRESEKKNTLNYLNIVFVKMLIF